MAGKTISNGSTIGVVLSNATLDNPVLVTVGGSIASSLLDAIYGNGNATWTIVNSGTLRNTATAAPGTSITAYSAIGLNGYGFITNGNTGNAAALISANFGDAIRIVGSGGVTNFGTIASTHADGVTFGLGGTVVNSGPGALISSAHDGVVMNGGAGDVTNTGKIFGAIAGVRLHLGGSITNGSTGSSTALISGGGGGVFAYTAPATVTNFASIVATGGVGVYLLSGGTVTNGASGATAAVISASSFGVLLVGTAPAVGNFATITGNVGVQLNSAGSVVNQGTISASGGTGVALLGGGYGLNAAGARISGVVGGFRAGAAATLVNAGTIAATGTATSATGAYFGAGGSLTNAATGLITGVTAIKLANTAASIGNAGNVSGSSIGILGSVAGQVVGNTGSIVGAAKYGVELSVGGSLVNGDIAAGALQNAAAQISGGVAGAIFLGGAGTLANYGQLIGNGAGGFGLYLQSAGTATNRAAGTIAGGASGYGIVGKGLDPGVIVGLDNAGLVRGGTGVLVLNVGASVSNSGSILATGLAGNGVRLASGQVTNFAGGQILGKIAGVYFSTAAGTLTNAGTVSGTSGNGALFHSGGTVVNGSGNTAALLTGVGAGARFDALNGTVVNAASIVATGYAIDLEAGGSVTNGNGNPLAVINGGGAGIHIATLAGSIVNAATISGTGYAIDVQAGGSVTNGNGNATALIAGIGTGLRFATVAGTLVNTATITGVGVAVDLLAGGSVTNGDTLGGGLLSAATGLRMAGGGRVSNAGTIIGNAGTAVSFTGTAAHRLVVLPGAVFGNGTAGGIGLVTAGTSAANVIELAGSVGSIGTISGLGSNFTGFQNITLDSGADWMLGGTNVVVTLTNLGTLDLTAATSVTVLTLVNNGSVWAGPNVMVGTTLSGTGSVTLSPVGTLEIGGAVTAGQTFAFSGAAGVLRLNSPVNDAGLLAGFVPGDLVYLPNYAHAGGDKAQLQAGNTLHVTGTAGTFDLRLAPGEDFTGKTFKLVQDGTGSSLSTACFAAGTAIRTEAGEIAVEALRPGDRVVSAFGGSVAVVWTGHRRVICHRHPNPAAVWPVRVRADAFAAGAPCRDLLLSPDHAIWHDNALVPIRTLLNGHSIVQEAVDTVTYWHVELPAHDVLFAAGLAAESYLDTGNRSAFANGGGLVDLAPDFAQRVWEAEACAPQLIDGPRHAALRAQLDARRPARLHATG